MFRDRPGPAARFIPAALIRETNTRLQDKAMFGSDYPFIRPDRWLSDFQNLPMCHHVILKARRALQIAA